MKAIAFNGSPRKDRNTAKMLRRLLLGAEEAGATTELVNLADFKYSGCTSCFACKLKNSKSYGHCALRDELTPLLEKALSAQVLVLGSPIYYAAETAAMRAFMERLFFPYMIYAAKPPFSLYPGRISSALVYTMGVYEHELEAIGYSKNFSRTQAMMQRIFGPCDLLLSTNAYQFDDYSKYVCPRFDPEAKKKHHEEHFPQDLAAAFNLGKKLVQHAFEATE